jgi:cytosine/adenosine deaminase-related metal-dependent hydrolase
MRSAGEIAKILAAEGEPDAALGVLDLLRMATLDGARALGWRTGSLEPGKLADIIVVRDAVCDPLFPDDASPVQTPLARLARTIFRARRDQVSATYVGGRRRTVTRNGHA